MWNYSCSAPWGACLGPCDGVWELRLKGICGEGLGIWHWAELGTSFGMLGTAVLLGLFSSPDLFAIRADSTHGCGLSPVVEHTATRSWRGTVFSQPGWTKCELGMKPHVLSWFVTDSSEMLSHLPRPVWDHWGIAGKEGWDYLLRLLSAVRCPYC